MNLPEKLKAVRKQHGYTRRQLAAELGRKYATITKYENGEREPGHTYLVEIAQKFGVTTDYLLGLEEFPGDGTPAPSAEAMQLARAFDTLDEWGKKSRAGRAGSGTSARGPVRGTAAGPQGTSHREKGQRQDPAPGRPRLCRRTAGVEKLPRSGIRGQGK